MSSLIESGHVVLEKMMKLWKFATSCTDSSLGFFLISKSSPDHSAQVSEKSLNQAKSDYLKKKKGASKCMTKKL